MIVTLLLVSLLACSTAPVCDDPALTCEAAAPVKDVVERLGGRPLGEADAAILQAALLAEAKSDPAASRHRVELAAAEVSVLSELSGVDGARVRGEQVYEGLAGRGVFAGAPTDVGTVLGRAVSEWARSDDDRLVLAESDIEGFLHYASLCREVQSGGPLRLSISDRGVLYQALVTRFREGSSQDRQAILAIGSGYWAAKDAWLGASYERQREFSTGAPLPPPMTATSVAYAQAIVAGDLSAHATNLHATLGPLPIEPASTP